MILGTIVVYFKYSHCCPMDIFCHRVWHSSNFRPSLCLSIIYVNVHFSAAVIACIVIVLGILFQHTVLPSDLGGSSVVECLTGDRGAAGSSLTGITVLCPWARHIYPSLVLVQPRKTLPYITERLLMGRKESNQTNKPVTLDLLLMLQLFWYLVGVTLTRIFVFYIEDITKTCLCVIVTFPVMIEEYKK